MQQEEMKLATAGENETKHFNGLSCSRFVKASDNSRFIFQVNIEHEKPLKHNQISITNFVNYFKLFSSTKIFYATCDSFSTKEEVMKI